MFGLIGWLIGLIHRRPRNVFRFWDGRRYRSIDPFVAARVLFSHPKFDWDETIVLLTMPRVKPQLETAGVIVSAVREAFGVASFDEGGLTELESIELLYDFRDYIGDVKKNGSLFPTSQPPTDGQLSPVMSMVESTKPDLDSGSTVTGNYSAQPGQPAPELSQEHTETQNQCVLPFPTPMTVGV